MVFPVVLARWMDFLAELIDLAIVYEPGATNVVADALSRSPAHLAPQAPPMAQHP